MFIFIIIMLLIAFKIYEYVYYKAEAFIKIKEELNEYTVKCNELNDHIEDLKETYTDFKKINYGVAELNDRSRYNFKREEQLKARKSEYIYDCSSTICKNAEMQPFKYLCKYFNIKVEEESLEKFENVLNNFSAAEEGKILLRNQLEVIKNSIKNDIPFLIRKFSMKKFMKKVGFKEIDFSTLYFPIYTFRYISPGGNKSTHCDIILNLENLNNFIEYLSQIIKFKKSAAGQRSLMTSSLREKIKERDNYECKKCKLSIREEPNLLLEIDHVLPISKGGLSVEENLQTLCWKCNRKKGSKISA